MSGRKINLIIDSDKGEVSLATDEEEVPLREPFLTNPKGPLVVPKEYDLFTRKEIYSFYPTGQVDSFEIEIANEQWSITLESKDSLGNCIMEIDSLT